MVIGLDHEFAWLTDRSLVDAFPAELSIREITGLLSSVGFSSPPSWLKPFQVLSQGEQFRARLARSMAEAVAFRHRTRRAVLIYPCSFRQAPNSDDRAAAGGDEG